VAKDGASRPFDVLISEINHIRLAQRVHGAVLKAVSEAFQFSALLADLHASPFNLGQRQGRFMSFQDKQWQSQHQEGL